MASSATLRLEQLAAPLRPVKAPWYVRHPVGAGLESQFPASGWYWIPAGHQVAVFLASGYDLGNHLLRVLVDRAEADDA
jgi:hypothetical protein